MKCPLCGNLAHNDGSWTENGGSFIVDYRCPRGHLIQKIMPEDWLTVLILNEDGDELYQLHFDEQHNIIRMLDWSTGKYLDMEGTGVQLHYALTGLDKQREDARLYYLGLGYSESEAAHKAHKSLGSTYCGNPTKETAMSNFTKGFNHEEFTVPNFILHDTSWEDVSWGNDAAPRWENKDRGLALWVFQDDPEMRECGCEETYKYVLVELIYISEEEVGLRDDDIFHSDDEAKLRMFIDVYDVKVKLGIAITAANRMAEPFPDLADELATAMALVEQELAVLAFHPQEIPNCTPSGESC